MINTAEQVTCCLSGSIATIAVDRQGKRNAFGISTWRALQHLVVKTDKDPAVKIIVVRGAGGHFGAGNDIVEFSALCGEPEAAEQFGVAMAAAMRAVEDARKPVIMAIEGMCYGASVALALAGDLRIAASSARFAITPAKLGALYLRSDLHRLVSAVGMAASKKLIYSAEAIDAAEALQMGLVDEVASDDVFDDRLNALLNDIHDSSAYTHTRTKAMLRGIGHGSAPMETRESLALFVEATQGADFREGTSAFLSKRRPEF